MVDARSAVCLAHAGEGVGRDKGRGDQRTRQAAHERLIKLQAVDQAKVVEEDAHGLARLAHVGDGKRVDQAASPLALGAVSGVGLGFATEMQC